MKKGAASSNLNSKQILKNRTKLEWALLIALLLIAYLLLASRLEWWPWNTSNPNLGTAFYITKRVYNASDSNGGSTGSGGSSGSSSSGGNGGGGGGGSSTSHSPLLRLAAGLDNGDTKEQVSTEAQGIDQNCALLVNSSDAGKQEVCVYREGNKIVTVTYLNDRVISASRSGF